MKTIAKTVAEGKQKYLDMPDFYNMHKVFYLEEELRWTYIIKNKNAAGAKLPLMIDTALHLNR